MFMAQSVSQACRSIKSPILEIQEVIELQSLVCKFLNCSNYICAVPSLWRARGTVLPLTTACVSPFRFTQNTFLEHHVKTRQQATMEKGIITLKHSSRSKFSPFFAKLLATNCCTYCKCNPIICLINTPLWMCHGMRM